MTALRREALAMVESCPEDRLESLINYLRDMICLADSKEARNAAYVAKLERSQEQLDRGDVIVKTWEELKAMENE